MRNFAAGFLFAYCAGAVPFGILLVRMDMPVAKVIYGTMTWPHQLMRVAQAAIVKHD